MSSATGGEADSPWPEVEPNMLITLRVKDSEGVRITRTMRRTDKLRDLTDFYLAMVPAAVAQGHVCRPVGAFMHYGRKVAGHQTPAEYDMDDGDEVSFFPDRAMSLPVTLTVKDSKGRRITRTMRRIEKLNVLFDLYYSMLPSAAPKEGFFVYRAGKVNGELMPTSYDMEDGDEITFVPISKPSMFVSLKMKDRVGRSVTRTLRRTDKLQDLIDFYHAMVPTDKYSNGEWQVVYGGKTVEDEKTPADYEMEDGDQISLSPVTKASFHCETDDDDEYGFYSASKRSMFVTITVRLEKNIEHTHTLRMTDEMQGLMDLCSSMLPVRYKHGCRFLFDGRLVSGSQTPDDLELEDGDMIDLTPCLVGGCMFDS